MPKKEEQQSSPPDPDNERTIFYNGACYTMEEFRKLDAEWTEEKEAAYKRDKEQAPAQWDSILAQCPAGRSTVNRSSDGRIDIDVLKQRLEREGFRYDGLLSAIRESLDTQLSGSLEERLTAVWERYHPKYSWLLILPNPASIYLGSPLPERLRGEVSELWRRANRKTTTEAIAALGLTEDRFFTPTWEYRPPPLWLIAARWIANHEGLLPAEQTAPPEKEKLHREELTKAVSAEIFGQRNAEYRKCENLNQIVKMIMGDGGPFKGRCGNTTVREKLEAMNLDWIEKTPKKKRSPRLPVHNSGK